MLVSFKTLGCKVNQYETEALKEQFLAKGYDVVGEDDFADIYIINTCTVTGLADRKSRQYIRRMKKGNPDAVVAVTGCYAQINPEEVCKIEGVNIVVGTNEKSRLSEYIESYIEKHKAVLDNRQLLIGSKEKAVPDNRQLLIGSREKAVPVEKHVLLYDELINFDETGIITSMESRTRAYIKIQEGCNRFCSYCVIPFARGRVRSRNPEDIVKEAAALIENGFKEIILTGINTALYGMEENFAYYDDGAESENVAGVEIIIRKINALDGDFRIRLSSLEPTVVNVSYVQRLFKYEKLCPHLHLSVQSGSNNVLQAMNRHYTREEYLDIVKVLKEFDQEYGITTDIIAGFPGESEEDFEESIRMINEAGFCRVHPFKYSKRPGTKAADMVGQISPSVKHDRVRRLAEAGEKASAAFFEANSGHVRSTLLEEYNASTGMLSGYSDNYIRVYLRCSPNEVDDLQQGFINVQLTEAYADGMLGELKP